MRRLVVAVVLALAFTGAARAAVPNPEARAFYVVNAANGDVLASRRAHTKVPIASITKLMTVLVALDHLKVDDVVTVSGEAAQVGESRIPLRRGQRISVHDLLAGALIQSANNAADALAHLSSARDVAVLAQVAMRSKVVRDLVRERSDSIEGGSFVVHTWNDLL